MAKFTTVVKIGLYAFIFWTGVHAGAQAPADSAPRVDVSARAAQACEVGGPGYDKAACDRYDAFLTAGASSAPNCQNADSQWYEAGKAFLEACAKAGMRENDAVACAKRMAQCNVPQGGTSSNDPNKPYDTSSSAQETLRQCPAFDGLDTKTLNGMVEQQRKAVSQMEREIPSLQKDLLSAKREASKNLAAAKKEAAQNIKNHGKELRDITNSAVEKNKAAQDKLNQLRGEITTRYAEIQQTKQKQIAASATLEETKTKIRLNCYTTASAQVSELQKTAMARQSMGSYNRGNQNQLLANVGMSSREAWQKIATKYYDWCITAQPATESFKSANTAYELTIGQLDQRVRDLNAAIDGLQAQVLQVVSPTPCLPGDQSSEVCRAQTAKAQDAAQSMEDFQAQQAALGEEMQQTQMDSQQTNSLNESELERRKKDIENERTRLTNVQEYLALKNSATGGQTIEQGALAEAFAKYSAYTGVARAVKECAVPGKCEDLAPGVARGQSICSQSVMDTGIAASDFLQRIGDTDFAARAITGAEPSTPRDAPTVCGDDSFCTSDPGPPTSGVQ